MASLISLFRLSAKLGLSGMEEGFEMVPSDGLCWSANSVLRVSKQIQTVDSAQMLLPQ